MIKIVGLSAVGLAATIVPPVTDTQCYNAYNSGLLGAVCDQIKAKFATSATPVARCAADTTAIMDAAGVKTDDSGTYSMAAACSLWAPTDCITQYCCGGPSGTDCGFFGPGSDPTSQCNSANMLQNFVYFGNANSMAHPPADASLNRCYGRTPGANWPYVPNYPWYPYYPYNWSVTTVESCTYVSTINGVQTNVAGLVVASVCYPIGTPVVNNCYYPTCGYLYPVNYYNYGTYYTGKYVDMYGNIFEGDYYLYYGYYGYNGYDMWGWESYCGGWSSWCGNGYAWGNVNYWSVTYSSTWVYGYGWGGYYLA